MRNDFSIFFPYTFIGMQIWPCKNVKGQPRVIIWTRVGDLESPMLYTKIQSQNFLGADGEGFFFQIWAWRPSYLTDRDHLCTFSIPFWQTAPHEDWSRVFIGGRSKVWRTTDGQGIITIAYPKPLAQKAKNSYPSDSIFNYKSKSNVFDDWDQVTSNTIFWTSTYLNLAKILELSCLPECLRMVQTKKITWNQQR